MSKIGDGGATLRKQAHVAQHRQATVEVERGRANAAKARAGRHTYGMERKAAQDEIAAYLAREPTRREY